MSRVAPRGDDPVRITGAWSHRDISANGIRLHVAEAGNGPLVLMLHGFAEFWWSWRHQLRVLARSGYRAVAVDLRGYGDSDKTPRGYDGWTLAGDVAGLIKALGEREAFVVGHGWGGLLAWTVAALHPRLVRRVAVVSAAHPLALRHAMARTALRGRTANQALGLTPVLSAQLPLLPERHLTRDRAVAVRKLFVRWSGGDWVGSDDFDDAVAAHREAMLVPGVAHSSLEYLRWAMRSQLRSDGRRFADAVDGRLRVPVLQLHGGADCALLASTARASSCWYGPHSEFHVLPDIGHLPHQEAPTAVTTALTDFFG